MGIETVYQDLALVNELSVFHNMFLNSEMTVGTFLNNRAMKEKTQLYLDDMGVSIPSIDTTVARLSGGQRQAIARVVGAAREKGLGAGIFTGSTEYAARMIKAGFNFVNVSSDARLMASAASGVVAALRGRPPSP